MNTKRWACKDGKKIRIKDMEDSHIINALKLLRRYGEAKHASVINFLYPISLWSEAAEDDLSRAEAEDYSDYVPAIYWDLHAEAVKRNLEND